MTSLLFALVFFSTSCMAQTGAGSLQGAGLDPARRAEPGNAPRTEDGILPPVQTQPPLQSIDVLHYDFSLTLNDQNDVLAGRARITLRFLDSNVDSFQLDLIGQAPEAPTGMRVDGVTRNDREVDHQHASDRLTIRPSLPLQAGEERTYTVAYHGVPADGLIIGTNLHGDRTFFGDNWPNRARHWLPTVDHVSDKASVEWRVTAPGHYDVVANGRLVERSWVSHDDRLTHWISEVPIPTKVMVMGAARFAVKTMGTVGGIPVQAWVYPQDREEGFFDFGQALQALRFFHEQVGPFPYAKLANVQSKTRYGGMENASNVFYSERAVRGDRRNEGLIVHEIAHQWFGDSVTEADWPHIWLSEGFATYFTHLYNEAVYGRETLVQGMERDRRTVLRFHQQAPGLPLIPSQLTDPNEMLNPNAYQKGGWVLHMLRRQVGDQAFWEGIRRYYLTFRDANADTDDLRRIMEEVSGQELHWFFAQWTERPGHPVLAKEWRYDDSTRTLELRILQLSQNLEPFRFPLDIGVLTPEGDLTVLETIQVTREEETYTFPLARAPSDLVLDPETWTLFQEDTQPIR